MYNSHQQMCIPYLELPTRGWLNGTNVFASSRCLTVLTVTSLCCAAGCMGGQSGDDGDFSDDGALPPTGPGAPEECGQELRPLEPDEETVFELSAEDLVAGLEQPEMPFHWVEYSSTNLTAMPAPPPSESKLSLSFTLRHAPADLGPSEAISEAISKPDAGANPCPSIVTVPVWIDLDTEDGALNARVKGRLVFYGARTAELYARFAPAELGGTFKLGAPLAKNSRETWSVSAYSLNASVWTGGSKGVLSPEFTSTSGVAVGDGSAVAPPPATPPAPNGGSAIFIPEAWEAVGVWPRLEQCLPGMAVDIDDAIIGKSTRDILDALNAHSDFALTVNSNATSNSFETLDVQLSTSPPGGLVCVNATPQTGSLDFTVDANLRALGVDAALPLYADLRLTVTGYVDLEDPAATLTRVRFERPIDDVAQPLTRETFESSTGVSLTGADAEYANVWWTWFGNVAVSGEQPSTNASFVVTSPNALQSAEVADQVAEGGPGFGIGLDENGQQLPGDTLLKATFDANR